MRVGMVIFLAEHNLRVAEAVQVAQGRLEHQLVQALAVLAVLVQHQVSLELP
jgi:hypothetical protein